MFSAQIAAVNLTREAISMISEIESTKNKNILGRFESKSAGSKMVRYNVKNINHSVVMLCTKGENITQAKKIAINQFGREFVSISQ